MPRPPARLLAVAALAVAALTGCPGEQGPDGCPHDDDTRSSATTCWHPGPGGQGRVYHDD